MISASAILSFFYKNIFYKNIEAEISEMLRHFFFVKRFIKNRLNHQLSVGLLAQLVERCTGIAEVIGFESCTSLIFFRLSFHNCKSCVYNCDDLLSI